MLLISSDYKRIHSLIIIQMLFNPLWKEHAQNVLEVLLTGGQCSEDYLVNNEHNSVLTQNL